MSDYQISLTIGVTGHRDIVPAEIPLLTQKLERFIDDLEHRYPNLPLLFITGMAEGADSLVADVASSRGCRVLNVLPMAAERYREDFSDAALPVFDRLLDTHETLELGSQDTAVNSRDRQYEKLGVFLAAHCHLLLALWDGKEDGGSGGTAEVIRFHQHDITSLAGIDQHRPTLDIAEDESDLVYHIACSRRSTEGLNPQLLPGSAHWLSRDDLAPRTRKLPSRYATVFQRMSEFNGDIARRGRVDPDEHVSPGLVTERGDAWGLELRQAFAHCDALAAFYQGRTLLAMRTTLGCALAAGLAFIVYADFANQAWSIYLYFVLVSAALLAFRIAKKRGWQRKYVDYRVLAEALRVQFYWAQAGVSMDNPSRFSHDRFFSGRDLDLGWIRNVLRSTGLRADSEQAATPAEVALAVEHWVGTEHSGQLGYYRTKSIQRLREHRATNQLTNACFVIGLIAAMVLAVSQQQMSEIAGNVLVALMGLLPLVAAARQSYAHRISQRELVAQYAQMYKVFGFAARLLGETKDTVQAQEILQDLGDAALNESAQWVLRQRERPLPGGDALA